MNNMCTLHHSGDSEALQNWESTILVKTSRRRRGGGVFLWMGMTLLQLSDVLQLFFGHALDLLRVSNLEGKGGNE